MTEAYERKLEKEMLEAAKSVADIAHIEQDPLLIILYRLNHQDRALESIKGDLSHMGAVLASHIDREDVIKESIDEMVSMWKGSKLMGRVTAWAVGILAAFGAAWASAKKGMFSL